MRIQYVKLAKVVPKNSEWTRSSWRSEKCRWRGSGMCQCTRVLTRSVYINEKKSYASLLSSQSTRVLSTHTYPHLLTPVLPIQHHVRRTQAFSRCWRVPYRRLQLHGIP